MDERAAIAMELLRRQRARESLAEYSLSIDIPGVPQNAEDDELDEEDPATGKLINRTEEHPVAYQPVESRMAIHHLIMLQTLQRCIETPRGRCMIFAPPGSSKSTMASVIATSWAMGRKRNQQIILASYATGIAAKQSRKVRAIARDTRYTCIWDSKPTLQDDQRAVDDWSMSNGSSLFAAGLLAGITGNRADGLIIDDPVANREQADSPAIQEKTYNEYLDTAMTRAKPKMWAVIIQTRWAENDLAGSILPEYYEGESGMIHCRDGQTWDVLSIPARAERDNDVLGRQKGDYLWTEWFPKEHWATWEDNPRAKRTWTALYQQRPAPDAGIHFSREGFSFYNPDLPRYDHL